MLFLTTGTDAMHDQSDTIQALPPATQPQLPPAANDSSPAPEAHAFSFTGSGSEYFRIWIVNLFLTVATLGVYSAWAKVRRLQYFHRNTHLAGAVFDFSGAPKAILKGRVLAIVLLTAYHYAFGFSLAIGLAILSALLVALPFLLRGALRFRLHNTEYRGLHFDFSGSAGGAYRAYLPPLLTLLLPGVLLAFDPSGKSSLLACVFYLGWPLMHSAMKGYQQRHLQFGATGSGYHVPARRFVKPYLTAMLAALAALFLVGLMFGFAMHFAAKPAKNVSYVTIALLYLPVLVGLIATYALYLLAGPYLQVRVANLVWSNTCFPGVGIRSEMAAWKFLRLQAANTVLTLATLGLYRPFAVVRVYRFRLAALSLHTTGSFEEIVAGAARTRPGATGDGVADFLGVDISW
jgi:uncharacterized membrane protein YjgN (DUF898 family)